MMESVLIKKTEKYDFYSDGRIWSHWFKRFLDGTIAPNGYNYVHIYGKTKGRHAWIAKAFISNPNNLPEVNHINENKLDNRVANLEWCTSEYNCNYGSRNEKLSNVQINDNKKSKPIAQYTLEGKLVKIWPSSMEIQRQLGFSHGNIQRCCSGFRKTAYGLIWKYIENN